MTSPREALELDAVRGLLPYRPPMLMIDRVIAWSDDAITAEKRVVATDPVVAGHLIHGPAVMPGVLLIEMVGQAGYLHARLRDGGRSPAPPTARLLGRCKARFFRPAPVGSRIVADVTHVGSALGGAVHRGRLTVDGQLIAEVEVMSAQAPPGGVPAGEEG